MAQPLTIGQKCSNFGTFLYNSETSQVLGRTARSWGEITLFYIVYYIFLSAFFVACFTVFNTTLDDHFPRLMGKDSLLKSNPGMGFKPMPDIATTLIRYDRMVKKSYEPYIKHIDEFIEKWGKIQDDVDTVDCTSISTARKDEQVPCKVYLNDSLSNCGEGYGYPEGKPCVVLKLNKIFDWLPKPYELNNLPDAMPQSLQEQYDDTKVWISCEGENPGDNDNLGKISYYPSQGFDMHFFPYYNQKGYAQPLIFVQLHNIQPNVGVLIDCKAWATNIWHDRQDRQGSIHFEIIID